MTNRRPRKAIVAYRSRNQDIHTCTPDRNDDGHVQLVRRGSSYWLMAERQSAPVHAHTSRRPVRQFAALFIAIVVIGTIASLMNTRPRGVPDARSLYAHQKVRLTRPRLFPDTGSLKHLVLKNVMLQKFPHSLLQSSQLANCMNRLRSTLIDLDFSASDMSGTGNKCATEPNRFLQSSKFSISDTFSLSLSIPMTESVQLRNASFRFSPLELDLSYSSHRAKK